MARHLPGPRGHADRQGRIAEAQNVLDLLKQQELIEFVRRDDSGANLNETASLTRRTGDEGRDQKATGLALAGRALNTRRLGGQLSASEEARITEIEAELDRSYLRQRRRDLPFRRAVGKCRRTGRGAGTEPRLCGGPAGHAAGAAARTVLLQAVSLGEALHLFLTTKDLSIHRGSEDRARRSRQEGVRHTLRNRGSRARGRCSAGGALRLLIGPIEADLHASSPMSSC